MAFITVRAIDGNVSKKGEVSSVLPTANFSRGNRLPRVLRMEVTGATVAQIEEWLGRLTAMLNYSIVAENPQRWRVRIELDPAVVAATGITGDFKQSLKSYILDDPHEGNWTATQFSQSPIQLTVNIAKGQTFDLTDIKADVNAWFRDKLETVLHFRRYFFPDSIIDPRVSQGVIDEAVAEDGEGNLPSDFLHDSITKAQALAVIVDRLA